MRSVELQITTKEKVKIQTEQTNTKREEWKHNKYNPLIPRKLEIRRKMKISP